MLFFILGNTEQTLLDFIEDIANKSLPIDKVTNSVLQGSRWKELPEM